MTRWAVLALLVAIATAGCSGGQTGQVLMANSCGSTSPQDTILQYAATRAVWNARHTAAPDPDPGIAGFDPTPGLGVDGAIANRYFGFAYNTDDREIIYNIRLPKGTPIDVAEKAALAEFPCDGEITSFDAAAGCAVLRSASVGQVLKTDPAGIVLAFFESQNGDGSRGGYDPNGRPFVGFLQGDSDINSC